MDPFPHTYSATIDNQSDSANVIVQSRGVPDLTTNAPQQYGGPGDLWSPETLLMAAVADCYVLSFRGIARASNLEWHELGCEVVGTLDKIDKVVRFSDVAIRARVEVPAEAATRAERILQKAKDSCLITNSLSASVDFEGVTVVRDAG